MNFKKKNYIIAQLILIFFSMPIACSGGSMNEENVHYDRFGDVPDKTWEKLAKKSIYFGHQSVGFNILDGVSDIIKERGNIPISIKEETAPKQYESGVLTHSRIGENRAPDSKLNGFVKLVNQTKKENADIMFFKFCYIDFNLDTDVKALFSDYQKAFEQLRKEHPNTRFIHVTAPLTSVQTGVKAWIKDLIGRPIKGRQENVKRFEYNQLMRAAYGSQKNFFDIAAAESTYQDGRRSSFELEGKTYFSLIPEYTMDGGHLNEKGRKIVAEQFLLTLANMV